MLLLYSGQCASLVTLISFAKISERSAYDTTNFTSLLIGNFPGVMWVLCLRPLPSAT